MNFDLRGSRNDPIIFHKPHQKNSYSQNGSLITSLPHPPENRMYNSDFVPRPTNFNFNGNGRKRAKIFSPDKRRGMETPISEPGYKNLPFSFHPDYHKNSFKKGRRTFRSPQFSRGTKSPDETSPYRAKNFIGTSNQFPKNIPENIRTFNNYNDSNKNAYRMSVPARMRDSMIMKQPKGDITAFDIGVDTSDNPNKRYVGDIYPGVAHRKKYEEQMNKFLEDFQDRNEEIFGRFKGSFDRHDKPGWRVLSQDPYFAPLGPRSCQSVDSRKSKNSYYESIPKRNKRKSTLFMSHKDIEKEYERKRLMKARERRLKEKRKQDPKWVSFFRFKL